MSRVVVPVEVLTMTETRYYLLAKCHGMRRFSGIAIYGNLKKRPDFRLVWQKARVSFFSCMEDALRVQHLLQEFYPNTAFMIRGDVRRSPYEYGVN